MAKKEFVTAAELDHFENRCRTYLPILRLNLIALFIAIGSFHWLLKNIELQHPALLFLFTTTPLLLAMIAAWSGSYRGAIWTCFISMFYFMAGVLNWTHPDDWSFGMTETLLSVLLFTVSLLYARWRGFTELPVK